MVIAVSVPNPKLCMAQQMPQEISSRDWMKTKPSIRDFAGVRSKLLSQEAIIYNSMLRIRDQSATEKQALQIPQYMSPAGKKE